MMPFGRPFLDYQLAALAEAGFARATLVIGPEHGAVRIYYREQQSRRILVDFAEQAAPRAPRGTADAVLAAEPVVGAEEFAVVNGDNLYPVAALRQLRALGGPGLVAFSADGLVRGGIDRERLRAFALIRSDADGFLAELVEKPDAEAARAFGPAPLVSMTCWRFSRAIFAACRAVAPSPRGELELPDAVRLALRGGERFRVALCDEPVLDLSCRADVPVVAARLAGRQVEL